MNKLNNAQSSASETKKFLLIIFVGLILPVSSVGVYSYFFVNWGGL